MKFNISNGKAQEIKYFEQQMYRKIQKEAEVYVPRFTELGYGLRLELQWVNEFHKQWSSKPIPMRNGYACYIYCLVEKDGALVRIESQDNDADYYLLMKSWMISCIYRRICKLEVGFFNDLDDVHNDLKELLKKSKEFCLSVGDFL